MSEMEVFAAALEALKAVQAKEAARDKASAALQAAQAAYNDAVTTLNTYRDQMNDLFGGAVNPRVRQG